MIIIIKNYIIAAISHNFATKIYHFCQISKLFAKIEIKKKQKYILFPHYNKEERGILQRDIDIFISNLFHLNNNLITKLLAHY